MLGKMQKICILVVIIAVVVVFVDANDLTKFRTTTLVETPKKTTAFPTKEKAQMNSKLANVEKANDENAQSTPTATTTTTIDSILEATIKKDLLSESPTKITTATVSSVVGKEYNAQNNVVNYQNVSSIKAKKNTTSDLVKNVEKILEDEGTVTSTQMNITEMLSDKQHRHGHVNDNVIQRKLQQTNEDATTTTTTTTTTTMISTAKITTTAIDNLEGVYRVKLGEFVVNDTHIPVYEIPDITTKRTITTTKNIIDLYPLQKSDMEPITVPIVFTYKDVHMSAEYRQNLVPNEVEIPTTTTTTTTTTAGANIK